MEENVALDSKKQKTFVKSIRGIKKLIKKNEKIEAKSDPKKKHEKVKAEKPFSMRIKDGKVKKKKIRKEKGLVYLSHIPHGFYEHQMTQYFKQFGVVTNARVIKSKRTGNSKGFAFVEFKEPSVAQIVAETMNNYLMGKRLIKAVYIPPEKQKRKAFRKHWNAIHNPSSIRRTKLKKAFNVDKDEIGELKKANKLLANLNKTKKKLSTIGINYDFFLPVDVPEVLLDKVIKKEKDEDTFKEENETKSKKGKKEKIEQKEDKKVVKNEKVLTAKQIKEKKPNMYNKNESKATKIDKNVKQEEKKEVAVKGNKKDNKPVKINVKQQKDKKQKLKDAGVKCVQEFISLEEEDSDDSSDFESDEYEKMLDADEQLSSGESNESGVGDDSGEDEESDEDSRNEDENSEESGDDDDSGDDGESGDDSDNDDDDSDDEEEEEEETAVPKKGKSKSPPNFVPPVQPKKQAQKPQRQMQQVKKQELKATKEVKRKAPQKPAVAAKKPKFEKQSQKQLKKQFKKK